MSDGKLKLEGIYSNGYGIIPKSIMKDKNLSIEAKAIYSYLCSYAGSGNADLPTVNLVCNDLNLSKKEFKEHIKSLDEYGYLVIEQKQ